MSMTPDERARIINCWHMIDRADRLEVFRSDPGTVEQAWRELRLKPVSNGVDVAKAARVLRRIDPRDPGVRNLSHELEGLARYLPRGMPPRGVD
jgi:hypothetical protein